MLNQRIAGLDMITVKGRYNDAVCFSRELETLDTLIHRKIPCRREIRKSQHPLNLEIDLARLRCAGQVNLDRAGNPISVPKDLAYVEGRLFDDYIHDMKLIQH